VTRHAFGIDVERCIGCYACTMACKQQNNPGDDMFWNAVFDEDGETNAGFARPAAEHEAYGTFPEVDRHPPEEWEAPGEYTPVACQHCDNAPCVKACPVEATFSREDGIVLQDYDKCIGCRYCMAACPYNVRTFNWESPDEDEAVGPVESRAQGLVEKCNWCVDRIDQGLDPACVEACPQDARIFDDIEADDSFLAEYADEYEWTKLLENFGTKPKVYYFTEETPGQPTDRLDPEKRDAEIEYMERGAVAGGVG